MAKKYLYGFDIGTSESKGTICDQDGNVIATAASAHSLKTPYPGWAEHDPIGDWWCDFKKITAELLQKSGIDPKDIAGIGVSAIMAAITPVDESNMSYVCLITTEMMETLPALRETSSISAK